MCVYINTSLILIVTYPVLNFCRDWDMSIWCYLLYDYFIHSHNVNYNNMICNAPTVLIKRMQLKKFHLRVQDSMWMFNSFCKFEPHWQKSDYNELSWLHCKNYFLIIPLGCPLLHFGIWTCRWNLFLNIGQTYTKGKPENHLCIEMWIWVYFRICRTTD